MQRYLIQSITPPENIEVPSPASLHAGTSGLLELLERSRRGIAELGAETISFSIDVGSSEEEPGGKGWALRDSNPSEGDEAYLVDPANEVDNGRITFSKTHAWLEAENAQDGFRHETGGIPLAELEAALLEAEELGRA